MNNDTCALSDCVEPRAPKRANGPRSLYCSLKCRRRAGYERTKATGAYQRRIESARNSPTVHSCEMCGESFTSSHRRSRFCSRRCDTQWRDANGPRCSNGCDRGQRARGLCQPCWRREARKDGREANPEWDARRRANHAKRLALKKGAASAVTFDRDEIFERDNWTCGLCSGPVDRDLSWPNPMSVSLDHIIPLSLGGDHSPENVQCSHLGCNVRKGNRLTA